MQSERRTAITVCRVADLPACRCISSEHSDRPGTRAAWRRAPATTGGEPSGREEAGAAAASQAAARAGLGPGAVGEGVGRRSGDCRPLWFESGATRAVLHALGRRWRLVAPT